MANLSLSEQKTKNKIFVFRGLQVMLDKDLGELYQVETRTLNQAVKRNIDRFPEDFMFQLSNEEFTYLISQNVTSSSKWGGTRKLPYAFTEQGVSMLASVLKSEIAVKIFKKSHDRFLIIDKKTIYHIGASLKDLGKKWFAFSKINLDASEMIEKLGQ